MAEVGPETAIREGTAAPLNGVSVGAGNLWERDYAPAGEALRRGPCAMLFVEGHEAVVVGEGSVIEIGAAKWLVLGVTLGRPRGEVRLAPLL